MSGLSVIEALAELDKMDRSMAAIERTAPAAVEAFGGREALLRCSQATCVGPVPRLINEEWAPLAAEHAELQRDAYISRDTRVGSRVYAGQEPGVDVHKSPHAGPMFSRS